MERIWGRDDTKFLLTMFSLQWISDKNMFLFMWFLQYYAESHAIIYIVDSSDTERIDESKKAFGRRWNIESLSLYLIFSLSRILSISYSLHLSYILYPIFSLSHILSNLLYLIFSLCHILSMSYSVISYSLYLIFSVSNLLYLIFFLSHNLCLSHILTISYSLNLYYQRDRISNLHWIEQ